MLLKSLRAAVIIVLAVLALAVPVMAQDLRDAVDGAIGQAGHKLGALDNPAAVACLTNAGYAKYNGQSTLAALDMITARTPISVGRGNLLVRPGKPGQPLYFMFIKKDGPSMLLASYGAVKDGVIKMQPSLDIFIGKGTSFEPFKKAYGPMAFNLVTLANGWAMGLPEDIMRAALIHGHLCCGVFTGYFVTRFIEKDIPLQKGEHYVYVGAPAWCQDDYIIDYMRLTPGTHGYVTMSYHWSKNWPTADKDYDKLGGVVVCYDGKTQKGRAYVLRFDWRHDDFRKYMNEPGLQLDWRGQPWLHNAYDRFFMSMMDKPEAFVSIYKQADINSEKDFQDIVGLGANPLQKLLGPKIKAK